MKKSIILSCVMMLLASSLAFAQKPQKKAKRAPEEIAQAQAVKMAETLLLSEKDAAKFIPVYKEYKLANRAINDKYRKPKVKLEEGQEPPIMTDKEIDEQIRGQFAKSQEVLDLRKAYYEKFLKVLTPRQAQQMYKLEKEQANNAMKRKQGGPQGCPQGSGACAPGKPGHPVGPAPVPGEN